MEQFEKFFTEIMVPRIKANTLIYEGTFEKDCERTWRTALEKVLTQLNSIYGGDFENSDIVKWIKSELEGGD